MRALLLLLCACAGGVKVATIPPRPDDVATVEGMMKAFYEVVNVGPKAPRQWDRDRTLYAPWMRFVAIDDEPHVMTHQEFVDGTEPLVAGGFSEKEIKRVTRRYGNIVHVDSTYETNEGKRGVNSLELYWDGSRWWFVSVIWQSETPALPIPPELLP
jgi:hypothetical protein